MKPVSVLLIIMLITSVFVGCGPGPEEVTRGQPVDPYRPDDSKTLEEFMEDGIFGIDTTRAFEDTRELAVDGESDFGVQEQTLSAENGAFQHQGVSLAVEGVFLEEEMEIEVTKMKAPRPLAGAEVQAYRFIPDSNQYDGLYTITIPFHGEADMVGAGYYNENTRAWEPVIFEVDEANKQVVITTHHLSTYGAFTIQGEGTRYARIASNLFEAHDHMARHGTMHGEVIQEALANEMTPGGKAFDLGRSIVSDWFTATGVVLEFEGLAYSSGYLSNLSDIFSNLGLALSIAQLAVEYSRGDQRAMAVNSFNTARGLAVGKWGTKALKVSMIGVTAIDYSLNRLREEAIRGREEIWERAYRLYYRERQARSGQDWYRRILELHVHADSPEQFQRMLENELDRYTYLFWQEDEATIAEYQSAVMRQGFTGGGGLNEPLKKRIADVYKSEILRDTLEPVFRRVEKEVRYQQFVEYQEELRKAKEELNRLVSFQVQELPLGEEQELKYAGYIIQLGPLADGADFRQWTGRLNQEGFVQTRFTVMGHLAAGAPNEIRLYETREDLENDTPELTMEFTVEVPETRVTIGLIEDVDLAGLWEGYTVITESAFAELDLKDPSVGRGNDDLENFLEGCEEEFGHGMMVFIQGYIRDMMHKDIPTTIEFIPTEDENRYTGFIHLRIEEVLESGLDIESEKDPFVATYDNGRVTMVVDNDGTDMYYTGTVQGEDRISGTFSIPSGEFDVMAGTWRSTRVEAD